MPLLGGAGLQMLSEVLGCKCSLTAAGFPLIEHDF